MHQNAVGTGEAAIALGNRGGQVRERGRERELRGMDVFQCRKPCYIYIYKYRAYYTFRFRTETCYF